jgi:hypothetical protein
MEEQQYEVNSKVLTLELLSCLRDAYIKPKRNLASLRNIRILGFTSLFSATSREPQNISILIGIYPSEKGASQRTFPLGNSMALTTSLLSSMGRRFLGDTPGVDSVRGCVAAMR